MRNQLLKLALLIAVFIGSPAYADPACGSDTSSAPDVARSKDVWLNGYCKSFLPCRLVLEKFHACQAAENFLSNLGAKEGVPLTESQVEEALVRTKGTASASTPRMAKMSANIERDRVAMLDSSTVSALQSDCTERACMNYREKQLNLLTSEVEKLNGNADILYWLPEYAPVQAYAVAERLGWARDNGAWKFVGAGTPTASAATTLGKYLLSLPECQKLYDRLAQEIKISPTKEPVELSLFEAECLPQVASYAEDVKRWHATFSAQSAATKPAMASENNDQLADRAGQLKDSPEVAVAVPPDAGLEQWNEELVAEEKQREAELAKQSQLKAQQQAELAAAQKREQFAAQSTGEGADKPRGELSVEMLMSRCSETLETTIDMRYRLGIDLDRYYGRSLGRSQAAQSRESLQLETTEYAIKYATAALDMPPNSLVDFHAGALKEAEGRSQPMQNGFPDPFRELALLRACFIKARIDSGAGPAATRRSGNASPAAPAIPSSSSGADCEAKLKAIDDQVSAALPRCNGSATCNLQAAMWSLNQQISTIGSYCPSGKFDTMLSVARDQLKSVTTTCNQLQSGGRLCEPKL